MKTKNIFKTVALAMLMPTMLLTTACSSDDDLANNTANTENTINKGYALPVTVNVTREGDKGSNRASYTDNGDGTGSLGFSTGDKLFVTGNHADAGQFAGTLDYDAVSGKFSGTVTTKEEYTGTADALFTDANSARAFLMPAGYGSYGFFSIEGSGYNAMISFDFTKAFALTKAAAVEQFSVERAFSYSSGFALTPMNAIANFTISGLTANKEVAVSFDTGMTGVISENVTTSAEGVATFVVGVGVFPGKDLKECTLTVDGNNIAMPTKEVEPGHIYNISRNVAPAPAYTLLSAATTSDYGKVVCADGHLHDAKTAVPDGCTAVGILGKVTETGHGLILALKNATNQTWNTINGWASASYAGTTLKVLPDDGARGTNLTSYTTLGETAVSNWAVAQKSDYEAIFINLGSTTSDEDGTTYDGNVDAYITGAGGTALDGDAYCSATEVFGNYVWNFEREFWSYDNKKDANNKVRPVLGF